MYINFLSCDDYFYENETIKNPDWKDIKNAILKLNGHNRSTVIIKKDEDNIYEKYMGISGGGKNKLYICFISTQKYDESEWILFNESNKSNELIEIMDGQPTLYNSSYCVELKDVLQAAKTYAFSGKRDRSCNWKKTELEKNLSEEEINDIIGDLDDMEDINDPDATVRDSAAGMINSFAPNGKYTNETNAPNQPEETEEKRLAQLQEEQKEDKEQLKNLQAQLKKVEAEIENSRRTNIWGRPQSGKSEAERDRLVQEIAEIQDKITQNESLIQDLSE